MSQAKLAGKTDQAKIARSEEEWRSKLTPEQFYVTRKHGTERAFSHPYHQEKDAGMYRCVCCGAPVFSSETQFDSAPAGRASMHRRNAARSAGTTTGRSSCVAPRFVAPNATRISVTCSRTDRSRRVRVIASTVSPFSSTRCQARQGQQVTPKHE